MTEYKGRKRRKVTKEGGKYAMKGRKGNMMGRGKPREEGKNWASTTRKANDKRRKNRNDRRK